MTSGFISYLFSSNFKGRHLFRPRRCRLTENCKKSGKFQAGKITGLNSLCDAQKRAAGEWKECAVDSLSFPVSARQPLRWKWILWRHKMHSTKVKSYRISCGILFPSKCSPRIWLSLSHERLHATHYLTLHRAHPPGPKRTHSLQKHSHCTVVSLNLRTTRRQKQKTRWIFDEWESVCRRCRLQQYHAYRALACSIHSSSLFLPLSLPHSLRVHFAQRSPRPAVRASSALAHRARTRVTVYTTALISVPVPVSVCTYAVLVQQTQHKLHKIKFDSAKNTVSHFTCTVYVVVPPSPLPSLKVSVMEATAF